MSFLAPGRGRLLRVLPTRRHRLPPPQGSGGYAACFRRCKAHFLLDGVEDAVEEPPSRSSHRCHLRRAWPLSPRSRPWPLRGRGSPLLRMERKRLAELRIKKRVKAQYLNGKFHDLMANVVASTDTLEDAYDIVRLNSNIDMSSVRDDVCFATLAELLRTGEFDVRANVYRGGCKEARWREACSPTVELENYSGSSKGGA
ncbi:hypothetical protein EE612_035517 [Oryza sativa]|nr:hypothetical protein EE612_035517 [Oryza sativa]